ncbi:rCG41352 [Rattus norvegicus]|uniref:RCG41352 n=1 Tax=Rattus norvegicus TaxID=10116 RepID=A6IHA0_RAT|nr:rCG41352 [Rattus norvegicus]
MPGQQYFTNPSPYPRISSSSRFLNPPSLNLLILVSPHPIIPSCPFNSSLHPFILSSLYYFILSFPHVIIHLSLDNYSDGKFQMFATLFFWWEEGRNIPSENIRSAATFQS